MPVLSNSSFPLPLKWDCCCLSLLVCETTAGRFFYLFLCSGQLWRKIRSWNLNIFFIVICNKKAQGDISQHWNLTHLDIVPDPKVTHSGHLDLYWVFYWNEWGQVEHRLKLEAWEATLIISEGLSDDMWHPLRRCWFSVRGRQVRAAWRAERTGSKRPWRTSVRLIHSEPPRWRCGVRPQSWTGTAANEITVCLGVWDTCCSKRSFRGRNISLSKVDNLCKIECKQALYKNIKRIVGCHCVVHFEA